MPLDFTEESQVIALTIPEPGQPELLTVNVGQIGPSGPVTDLTLGTVTTGAPGTAASATLTGTAPNKVLNLTIPRGDAGTSGSDGVGIPTGGTASQVLAKIDGTNYNAQWVTPLSLGSTGTTAAPGNHTHPATGISDSTTVGRSVLTATDAAAARSALGAGTSSLALGTTSSTAAAGNHTHAATGISDSTTVGRSVLTAADAAAARTAIGAGTSSLALGTTGSTAAAGNHSHTGMVTSSAVTTITQITAAAYAALGTKDANTLYVVVG